MFTNFLMKEINIILEVILVIFWIQGNLCMFAL